MRTRLVLVAIAVLALVGGACGKDLPNLPGQNASATGETAAARSDMSLMPYRSVHYELADGVTVDTDTAKAYKLEDGSTGAVERLARALGVTEPVKSNSDGWTAGALYVSRGGGNFSMYTDASVTGSSGCAVPPVEPDAPADAPVTCEDVAPAPTTAVPPGTAPTEVEARRIATKVLEDGGVDLRNVRVLEESFNDTTFNDTTFNVRFQPTFDGHTVDGYEHVVTVDATKKIVGVSGYLGAAKSVGSYDLATLKRAVERLNETAVQPLAADGRESLAVDAVAPDSSEPVSPESTEPIIVRLGSAEVGLMMQGDSRGALWLVPAYIFLADNGDHVVAAAADDKYIEPPTTGPTTKTDPPSGGGSDGGGSGGSTGSGNCRTVDSDAVENGNAAISGQVCASTTTVKVGEPVTFTITAGDPDRAFTDGPCGDGVTEEFGDDSGGAVRCLACAASVPEGPGKIERKREHTYAKAGVFTATFTIQSGTMCESAPHDSTATLSIPITVT